MAANWLSRLYTSRCCARQSYSRIWSVAPLSYSDPLWSVTNCVSSLDSGLLTHFLQVLLPLQLLFGSWTAATYTQLNTSCCTHNDHYLYCCHLYFCYFYCVCSYYCTVLFIFPCFLSFSFLLTIHPQLGARICSRFLPTTVTTLLVLGVDFLLTSQKQNLLHLLSLIFGQYFFLLTLFIIFPPLKK